LLAVLHKKLKVELAEIFGKD